MLADVETFLKKLKGFSVDEEYITQLCSKERDSLLKVAAL